MFLLKTWNLIFFENLKIIGGKFLPGKLPLKFLAKF